MYTNAKEFYSDLELVFNNCIIYNGEKSVFGNLCNNVRNEFKKLADEKGVSVAGYDTVNVGSDLRKTTFDTTAATIGNMRQWNY